MPAPLPPLARRTALTLAVAQCFAFCAVAIGLTLTGLVGQSLAPRPDLGTLPYAAVILSSAATTIPLSLLMGKIGRRGGFLIGAASAILAGSLAALAVIRRDFALFCLGNACLGVFQASSQYYRYAATDAVDDPAGKARALSWVMLGSLAAAFLGPQIAALSRNIWDLVPFAGSYAAIAALGAAAVLVLATLPAAPAITVTQGARRPLAALIRQPRFLLGTACTALGFGTMTFVMTATPLAVVACGFSVGASASVIQAHLVGMFAPAFVTGKLIARVGVIPVLAVGLILFLLSALAGLSGLDLPQFTVALVLNGIGWNLLFVGGSTLIAQSAEAPQDRARLQALSEFTVFGLSALAAVTAGSIQTSLGWDRVLNLSLIPVTLLGAGVMVYRLRGTKTVAA